MTKRERQGITIAEFARTVGANRAVVMKRIKAGKMSECVFPDGSLDEEVARVEWFATTDPNRIKMREEDRPKPPRKNAAQHAEAAKEKRSEYELKRDRMEVDLEAARIGLANLKKTHMPAEEARKVVRAFTRVHRDHMLNFANRHGAAIAAMIGAPAAATIAAIEAAMREHMNELADTPMPFEGTE